MALYHQTIFVFSFNQRVDGVGGHVVAEQQLLGSS